MKQFTTFDPNRDIITKLDAVTTTGIFTDGAGTKDAFYTGSDQSAADSSNYYLHIYDDPNRENIIFDISFGCQTGLSYVEGDSYANTYKPDQAIYGQYANLCLPDGTKQFILDGSTAANEIFVIAFNRTYFKDGIDANSIEFSTATGPTLTCSGSNSTTTPKVGPNAGPAYYMESGGIKYGHIYPKLGLLILNNAGVGVSGGASSPKANIVAFYDAFKDEKFVCRSEEQISTTHYFCRLYNDQYNFTNNPTWQTGSAGLMKYEEMYGEPQVYVTTIGLYDDKNQLLATAKLNKPQLKNFERELLIKVRISY